MFIEIHEIYTMAINILHNEKLDSKNKVFIHNCCHAPKMANDKEEALQLMYLSKDIMNRQ